MWYSNQKILSYNKLFNFIIGNRGGGKSFNAKDWAIRGFINHGKQFIYLRRYKTELKRISNYFDDIAHKYPDHQLVVKGTTFYIDGNKAGWAIPLSTALTEKSASYPNVDKIIFDEFIIEKGTYHYLQGEVQKFLDFYETVARIRDDVRVEFISNAITIVNPYFQYFGIFPKRGSKFTKGDEWVIEMYKSDEFVQMKKNTRFGKLIDKTEYGRYNIDNEFLLDNNNFIESMTGKCLYQCTITYMGVDYGVWFSEDTGLMYINNKIDKSNSHQYCFTTKDHNPNYLLLKTWSTNPVIKRLKTAYDISYVRFNNLSTRNAFYEFMKLI